MNNTRAIPYDPEASMDACAQAIGHRFQGPQVLRLALTHRSMAPARDAAATNERLEFLGDRVLSLVIAEALYDRFPHEDEGRLARRHTGLVRKETLARLAAACSLGTHIRMSRAEEGGGGRTNANILADACEAVIGALYLDGGLDAARRFLLAHWNDMLEHTSALPPKDAKTRLQEWAQQRRHPLPVYETVATGGPAHKPMFTVRVTVRGEPAVEATGVTRRGAEQEAAEMLLRFLSP